MGNLQNRVAVVTGASRGIGRAIALTLAEQGARLVINYHASATGAEEVVARIRERGGEAVAVQADVSQPADADRLIQFALEFYGRADILVANAGIARDALSLRMSEADWDSVVDTNLKGAFLCARAIERTLLKQRWGRIVFTGSVVGLSGNVGQANYAAAKAGLIGLGRTLARELGSRGITVNIVAPGFIETDMTSSLSTDLLARARERIALGRLGRPEDVAALVGFLCSDDAAYITGQVIGVDGGLAL